MLAKMSSRTLKKSKAIETALKKRIKGRAIYEILKDLHELKMSKIVSEAEKHNIPKDEVREILDSLKDKGLIYEPKEGLIELVEY